MKVLGGENGWGQYWKWTDVELCKKDMMVTTVLSAGSWKRIDDKVDGELMVKKNVCEIMKSDGGRIETGTELTQNDSNIKWE